jgi:EAL domain-containing protein (putative c-di-GMP-specific phosphodiesterase class I)
MPAGDMVDLSVLVVDDEAVVRLAMCRLLQRLGVAEVQEAEDGRVALRLIRAAERPVDLVICDLSMPSADGLVCLRWLADLDRPPAVMLVSGHDHLLLESARRLGESLQLRVIAAEQKPITLQTLTRLLKSMSTSVVNAEVSAARELGADEILRAIDNRWFETWFQPQLHVGRGRVTAVEALLRLRHPERGLIEPASFIASAEAAGLIGPLTDIVLASAAEWSARWRRAGHAIAVSVNLSKSGLTDLAFPDRALQLCAAHGIAPADVTFELTESSLGSEAAVLLDIASRLRLNGFRLSLDDFGTGYSSLAELRSLPFHEIKLDRQFVQTAGRDPRSLGILRSSVALARELGLTTVAEGVENESMLELVTFLGCQYIQGYLIARPMPAAEVAPWLSQQSPRHAGIAAAGREAPRARSKSTTHAAAEAGEDIVSRFAHDVASPLSVILSLSEMIRDDPEESAERRADSAEINAAADQIAGLVKALRDRLKIPVVRR